MVTEFATCLFVPTWSHLKNWYEYTNLSSHKYVITTDNILLEPSSLYKETN